MVEELIGRLDRWLASNRPDYYALLQPGATDAELDAVERQFSVKLPAAFRLLYRWRSGQDLMSSDALQGNRSFLSLPEVAGIKEMLDGMIGYDFDDPRYWRRGWCRSCITAAAATCAWTSQRRTAGNPANSLGSGRLMQTGQ